MSGRTVVVLTGFVLATAARAAVAQVPAPAVPQPPPGVRLEGQGQAVVAAQSDETVSIAVQVTESSGESVFLDQGRDSGISIGNRVLLYSRTHGILAGSIRAVSAKSSNCRLDAGALAVEVGTRGEVFVPKRPPAGLPPPAPELPSRPEHPPWTHAPQDWNSDSPLLMPAFARQAGERPAEVTGFSFIRGSYSTNQFGTGNEYLLGEAGADLTLRNAVPGQGVIRLRAEYFYQAARIDGAPDTRDGDPRVDWFSCVWGDLRKEDLRTEVGRFLQHEFAELGLLDGAEGAIKVGSRWHVGASVGAMPDYRRRVEVTGDYQGAVFGKFLSGPHEEFSVGVAFQKTLHNGAWDRDLLVAVAEFIPSASFSARASAWVDYYTGTELVKSQGFELTEAHAYASYRFDPDNNAGLFFTRNRRPDVLRDELAPQGQQPTPEVAEMLRQNLSLYYGAYSWHRLSKQLVGDTRVSAWSDQTHRTGVSGEGHVGLQDWVFDKGEVGLTGFYTDGIYTRGPGARLSVSHFAAPVSILAWYEAAWYENTTTGLRALQQSIHLSVDSSVSETWSLSVSADYRFGFQQDSVTFLISIMKRIQ
jgi:hypothetical protein